MAYIKSDFNIITLLDDLNTVENTFAKRFTISGASGFLLTKLSCISNYIYNIISIHINPYYQPFCFLQSLLVACLRSSTFSISTPSRIKICQTWFLNPIGHCGRPQYRTFSPRWCAPLIWPRMSCSCSCVSLEPQILPMELVKLVEA